MSTPVTKPKRGDASLTEKEQRFVEEYPKDFNATQAAIRSGYSRKSAAVLGWRLLRKVNIQAALSAVIAQRSEASKIDAARVLEEIDAVALSDIGDLFDLSGDVLRMRPMREWPEKARRAVASVKVREYPEKFPPLSQNDFDTLEAIATGKGYTFDISRAILPDDQVFMQGLVRRLREIDWNHYTIIEVKLWPKPQGTEQAGKHRQMFTDRVEVTGRDGAPLVPMETMRRAVQIAEERGLSLVNSDPPPPAKGTHGTNGKRRIG